MDQPTVTDNISQRVAVRITPDALRQVRAGHPWVYANSVRSVSPEPRTGDLAVIFDQKRKFAAIGLYDAQSAIAIRVLHQGAPTTIDAAWFANMIQTAAARRELLHRDPQTTAYRLIHGENDGLPGLVVDRYESSLIVKLYSSAWFAHLDDVVSALGDFGDRAFLRLSRHVQVQTDDWSEGQLLFGTDIAQPIEFLENGLTFSANLIHGHKTGHFLDQRENRQRIRELSANKTVLDVFSCTGGFTVHAAAGGAQHVTAIDISQPAVDAAMANMQLNAQNPNVAACTFSSMTGDAFEQMKALVNAGTRFDLIVLDPPSYTSKVAHRESAKNTYGDLTALALRLLEPDGILLQASCSALIRGDELEGIVASTATQHGWRIDSLQRFGQPLDHPVGFAQGEYLDAVLLHLNKNR